MTDGIEQRITPERRLDRQTELQAIHRQLREGEKRMGGFEALLEANTKLTQETATTVDRIDQNTASFVAFSNDLMGGTRFLCRLARGLQWSAEMVKNYWAVFAGLFAFYAYATNQFQLLNWILNFVKH
jgi:hypothetical protein